MDQDRSAWLYGPEALCRVGPRPQFNEPRRLILLGAPGAGKGTLAAALAEALGACVLSTGEIFRALPPHSPESQTPEMRTALDATRQGELVADATILDLVRERSGCLRCRGGFILNGFPRTLAQAEALESLLRGQAVKLDAVLNLEVPAAIVEGRVTGRRNCPVCGGRYHLVHRPPRRPNLCDLCQVGLVQRPDDQTATIRARMNAYLEKTACLVEFYRTRKLLLTVPAGGTPQATLDHALDALTARSVRPF